MSRRLGDDPLTRARAERAKAAEVSASVALESGERLRTAQVGVQTSPRMSYNDVFFERRGEGVAAQQAAKVRAPDVPEITEISEIPEIREAAAASESQATIDVAPDVRAEPVAARGAEVAQATPVSIMEEVVVTSLDGTAADTSPTVAAIPQANEEPARPPIAPQAPPDSGDESKVEPPKGGFFKRLFGKFK